MKKFILFKLIICVLIISNSSFAQTSNPDKYKYNFVVAKDGSGDYKYLQDAIDAMRVFPLAPITLYIKTGYIPKKSSCPKTIPMLLL